MARGGAGGYNAHRLFADHDEDLQAVDKKDDDRRLIPGSAKPAATWKSSAGRFRSKRRIAAAACAVLVLWLLVRSIPAEFWEPNEVGAKRIAQFHHGDGQAGGRPVGYQGPRPGTRPPVAPEGGKEKDADGSRPPPRPNGKKATADTYYYDGEILFTELSKTIHGIVRTMGFRKVNQNVLFAASSLKSLGALIPLACEMSSHEGVLVHLAVFGRSEMVMDEILHINGVDRKACKVYWHDARPNWAGYSSDFRVEASVAGALEHIQTYMHPQVVITDDSSLEDPWFTRQVRAKSTKLDWPIIELPAGAPERLHWLCRLDAQALRAFRKTNIDIVVQPSKGEAGGLLRLLKSLKEADYRGLPAPRLTVELPADIDPMVNWYISDYKWPPTASPMQPVLTSHLNVRHRIPGQSLKPEEASLRFLESFYPTHPESSHVLVLNPNVELSPLYYHWLMYYILFYKHSRAGATYISNLVGMSLVVPSTYLNGTTDFDPPAQDTVEGSAFWSERANPRHPDTRPPFIWQAPDSNAVLYFGDKWAEIHDFLKHRIRSVKESGQKSSKKLIGEHLPAWTEYFLEITRARGWIMLYPPTSQDGSYMATVHTELWKPPEEFTTDYNTAMATKSKKEDDGEDPPSPSDEKEPLRALTAHWQQPERPVAQTSQSLQAILPFKGEEPLLKSLPHLLYDGTLVQSPEMTAEAHTYIESFRETIGGCAGDKHEGKRKVVPGKAGDLFCWGDEPDSDWEKVKNPSTEELG